MGFENWKKKPDAVRNAALDGDKEHLSAMGKKGAEAAHAKQELNEDIAEVKEARLQELQQEETNTKIEEANEHIIDPDGNDLDYSDEN